MRNVNQVLNSVRSLLGDRGGQWVTMGYVLPLMDICYGDLVLAMKNASTKHLCAVVPILNVPAGTSSLYPWQQATADPGTPVEKLNPPGLLSGLTDVIEIYVKPAGAPADAYSRIRNRGSLPHVSPALNASQAYLQDMYWTMIGNQLLISQVQQALDIEVTGKFSARPLTAGGDFLVAHEDAWIPVTFGTAAIAGIERSNPAILKGYADRAVASTDNLIAEMIRSEQGQPARFQRISRDSGDGTVQWFWGV